MAPRPTPPKPPAPSLGTPTPTSTLSRGHAGAAVAELFTASGRNPFRVTGPFVVSFSGGRTSGLMLRKVLDAFGGALPPDGHIVFTNTGAEDNRTLDFVRDCAEHWGARVRWLEFAPSLPAGYREVDYDTADRAYGPFNECIRTRKALPNGRMRFCTQDMKLGVLKRFMRDQGYADDEWTNVVGIRADERHRLMKLRARPETMWDVVAPLLDAGVTKPDVLRWWGAQPFDLQTPEFAGNCCACLAGETEVVTRDGLRPIRELAGSTVELLVPKLLPDGTLSEVGAFVEAPVRAFGVQRLWRGDLVAHGGGTKTVYATRDHRWFLAPRRPGDAAPWGTVWTERLVPEDQLRSLAPEGAAPHMGTPWVVAAVTPTERVEEVYCATVDGVGAFGLADGLMTGNCFLKGKALRWRVEHAQPGALSWWAAQEAALGRTFIHKEPLGYAEMQRRVRLGILPGQRIAPGAVCAAATTAPDMPDADDEDADDAEMPCDCTG